MRTASHIAVVELAQALREILDKPKLLDGYAKECAEAVRLTDAENEKRQAALAFIEQADQLKNELDIRARKLDELGQDIAGRAETVTNAEASHRERKAEFELYVEGQNEREAHLNEREHQLENRERDVTNRENTVKAGETALVEAQMAHDRKARKLKEALT